MFAYGLVLALFNSLWTLSMSLNGAAVATVLVYSSGAFTAILGRLLLKERLGSAKVVAVALSIAGGLSYAGYSLMGRSAADRGRDPHGGRLRALQREPLSPSFQRRQPDRISRAPVHGGHRLCSPGREADGGTARGRRCDTRGRNRAQALRKSKIERKLIPSATDSL